MRAVSARGTQHDEGKRAATAKLQRRVQYHENVWDEFVSRMEACTSKSSDGGGSLKVKYSESKCKTKQ